MTVARPWIAYVGPFDFPDGGAAARRILGNAKALVAAGYEVAIVSGQMQTLEGEYLHVAKGIRCASVNERIAEHLPKGIRYAQYALMGARTRSWLNGQPTPPAAVILYSGYSPYLLQMTPWAQRRDIPILFDAVEWYCAKSVMGFVISPYLWNTEVAMRILIPRLDGVIAISTAMESYYVGRGMRVRRVPPLFDPEEIDRTSSLRYRNAPIRLAYCGSVGTKDLLEVVIDAVISQNAEAEKFLLEIAGPTEAEICDLASVRKRGGKLPSCMRVYGRVSHARSLEIVGSADFTVFVRPVNRNTTYGFPTKFVESLALGTPVIANLTSDLGDHLRDGETGLVCSSPTQEGIEAALNKAFELGAQELSKFRSAARSEAIRAFAYDVHALALGDLVNHARQRMEEKKVRH